MFDHDYYHGYIILTMILANFIVGVLEAFLKYGILI